MLLSRMKKLSILQKMKVDNSRTSLLYILSEITAYNTSNA